MAQLVWWTIMAVSIGLSLWGLVADLVLIRRGEPSITDYLRNAPWAFWGPLIVLVVAVMLLAVHLYSRAVNGQ
jgi:hypothetical protein